MIAELDKTILHAFAGWRSPLTDHFFLTITWLGSLWVLLPASLVLAALRWPSSQAAWLLPGTLLLAGRRLFDGLGSAAAAGPLSCRLR